MTHDAEDIIHPDSLRWVNYFVENYDMVQVPVLALPTPMRAQNCPIISKIYLVVILYDIYL